MQSCVVVFVQSRLSVCLVQALAFESLDVEGSFLACSYTSSEYLGQVRISRSSGQGQGHRSKNACLCVLVAGGMLLTEGAILFLHAQVSYCAAC